MIESITASSFLSYLVLFVALAASGIGVSAGEEAVLLFAGHLVGAGVLLLPLALPVCILGVVAADFVGFQLGRRGLCWFPGLCKRIHSHNIQKRLDDARFIFLSRFIAPVRGLFPIAAGMHGIEYSRYFRWNVLAALVFVPVVFFLGVSLGKYVYFVIGAIALVSVCVFVAHRFLRAKA